MFNINIVQNQQNKFNKLLLQTQKSQFWLTKYKTIIRPALLSKHERRITGFAKKMQCDPVVLPQKQIQVKNDSQQLSLTRLKTQRSKTQFEKSEKRVLRSQSEFKMRQFLQPEKYTNQIICYRERVKTKEIHPPMKYTQKNTRKIIPKQSNKSTLIRLNKTMTPRTRTRRISCEDFNSLDQTTENNFSDFDEALAKNQQLQIAAKAEGYKTEKQLKEEEELKSLSHNRLYFKSLVHFEDRLKDKTIKKNVRDILIKCKVFQPPKSLRKIEQDRDLFVEMMNPRAL